MRSNAEHWNEKRSKGLDLKNFFAGGLRPPAKIRIQKNQKPAARVQEPGIKPGERIRNPTLSSKLSGTAPAAEGTAREVLTVVPRAAPEDTVNLLCVIPGVCPFPDVAAHVQGAPRAGAVRELPDYGGSGLLERIAVKPFSPFIIIAQVRLPAPVLSAVQA